MKSELYHLECLVWTDTVNLNYRCENGGVWNLTVAQVKVNNGKVPKYTTRNMKCNGDKSLGLGNLFHIAEFTE